VIAAMTPKSTPKSEATRTRILTAALQVFRERGFTDATMREIAVAAGVAVGAAYYYYDSKDALVMAFYEESQARMIPALERTLIENRTLEDRLRGLIQSKFEHFAPNRALMSALSAHIDPAHPLSPFSEHTAAIRARDTEFFARAIADSRVRLPSSIQPYLPRLLWLYQMGLMLYWVYDRSPAQANTHMLFDKTLRMMLFAIKIASVPLLRPLYRPAGELLRAVYGESPQ
jgi:AcrR family transcriptional regulator